MKELDIKKVKREFKSRFSLPFRKKELLLKALKHKSYLIVTKEKKNQSNERLEFLGDSILNFVLTEYLYNKYPDKTEGQLSKMKSILVSKQVLADISKQMNLGQYILMNHGEEKTGGRERTSLIADAVEALIGAIYLDRGMKYSKRFIEKFLIKNVDKYISDETLKNFKSELLEIIQSSTNMLPVYKVHLETGPEHEKEFEMKVYLNKNYIGSGSGKTKKSAEQNAARAAIEFLKANPELLK